MVMINKKTFSQLNIVICMKVGGEVFSFKEKEPKGQDV